MAANENISRLFLPIPTDELDLSDITTKKCVFSSKRQVIMDDQMDSGDTVHNSVSPCGYWTSIVQSSMSSRFVPGVMNDSRRADY